MKLRDLIANIDKPILSGDADLEIAGIAYDSRKVARNIAFVALRGTTSDGHQFIEKAIAQGAVAIVAEVAPPEDCKVAWVHVKNTRLALADMAASRYEHPADGMLVSAVTGTNGKTTTAFLVHHLMNKAHVRCGLLGTVQYDIGGELRNATHTTPESLEMHSLFSQMRAKGCRAVALEASSHALDQGRIHGIRIDAAIFTNLTQDHLDYHRTMEAYFEAKVKLFEQAAMNRDAKLIINLDDAWGRKLIQKFENHPGLIRYGLGVAADYRAINVRYDFTGTSFELEHKGRGLLVRSPLIGGFNVYNALAAIAAAHGLGCNLRETVNSMKTAPQIPGRLERVTNNEPFQIFVDYAHTPDAIINVLSVLRALRPNRIITVFGCGGDRDRTKRAPMAKAAEEGSDVCILTSDNPRTESAKQILDDTSKGFQKEGHAVIEDREEAIRLAISNAEEGDIIVIAGKGHEAYQEINGTRYDFDDRLIAKAVMKNVLRGRLEARERDNFRR